MRDVSSAGRIRPIMIQDKHCIPRGEAQTRLEADFFGPGAPAPRKDVVGERSTAGKPSLWLRSLAYITQDRLT